jgi:hypothetical protein
MPVKKFVRGEVYKYDTYSHDDENVLIVLEELEPDRIAYPGYNPLVQCLVIREDGLVMKCGISRKMRIRIG